MTLLSITRSYAPAPPVLGYVAWYDASDLSTIIQAAGLVSQWNDKSANLRNVAQATNKPLTGASINGLNALSFDGTNDTLAGARAITAQPYTIFCVALNLETGITDRNVWGLYDGGASNGSVYSAGAGVIRVYAGAALVAAGQGWAVARPHVVSAVVNGASSVIAVDGRPATVGNAGTVAPGATNWSIGSNREFGFWKGYIGEVIAYASALSDASRLAVEQYLIQKWLY